MKRISILLCSVILTFDFSLGQNQNLLQGFFSKLHNEGEKVKADVHNLSEKIKSDVQKIFRPNAEKRINADNRENYEEGLIFVTSSTGTPTTAENIYVDRMFFPTEEPVAIPVTPEVTPKTPEVTPTTPEVTPKTPEVTPTTPAVTPKPTAGKAADGEGKENFVGGCLPGYKRTADGRCMEEYK